MKNLNEVLAEIRKIGLNNDANSIVKIIKGNQCFAESNLNKIQDLIIHRGGISKVVYKAEEVDKEEYDYMKKIVEKTKKDVEKMKKELKTMFVSKEMEDIKKAINSGEQLVKDYNEKIEPWMSSILKNKVTSAFKDPTKEEMVKFLHDKYKGHLDYTDEELEFPIEAAIYWYAYDYHSGQNSNLYSALSTSEYKPGSFYKSIDDTDDDVAQEMYSNLQTKYGE
jgi:hypothetical protein